MLNLRDKSTGSLGNWGTGGSTRSLKLLFSACEIDSAAIPTPDSVATVAATVTRVIDGDTIDVTINGTIYTVRYIGVDTSAGPLWYK